MPSRFSVKRSEEEYKRMKLCEERRSLSLLKERAFRMGVDEKQLLEQEHEEEDY